MSKELKEPESISIHTPKLCIDAYYAVRSLIAKNVVNHELSLPLENIHNEKEAKIAFVRKSTAYYAKNRNPKILVARYGFLMTLFLCACLVETMKDEPKYLWVLFWTLVGIFLAKIYQCTFGYIPLQSIGIRVLGKQQAAQIALEQKADKTLLQAARAGPITGPINYFRFLVWDK